MTDKPNVSFQDADGEIGDALEAYLHDYRKKFPDQHPLNKSYVARQAILKGLVVLRQQSSV